MLAPIAWLLTSPTGHIGCHAEGFHDLDIATSRLRAQLRDYSAPDLRRLAAASRHAHQSRRLLSLATVLDGMDRQTPRVWVHRFNELGSDGLRNIRSKRNPRRLYMEQWGDLLEIFETGPDWAFRGVVR